MIKKTLLQSVKLRLKSQYFSFKPTYFIFAFALLCCPTISLADLKENLLKGILVEGINVDLREPLLCDGVLTTTKGGVITGPGIRIQAQEITYTRKSLAGEAICNLKAEGDLILEFGDYIFVGESLEYDFQTRTGIIYCGRTGRPPWFLGGESIHLCADGSYTIRNGFITTSESYKNDWQINAEEATLKNQNLLSAKNVRFSFYEKTLFWLSQLNFDLDMITDHPIRYSIGWGGRQGPRVGMKYEIFSWERVKTFLRLDYRLSRGPGIGIDTSYHSADRQEFLETINYIARDNSIFLPHERLRYRIQGVYHNLLADKQLSIDLSYDKLSDRYMATDYADQGLDIEEAERTQLDIRRQSENWIINFLARPRINTFETIKQELPTFQTNWRPYLLGPTGIISDNQVKISYLDYVYAHNLRDVHDYNATRIACTHRLYRPFTFGPLNATPQARTVAIFYGNSSGGQVRWLLTGVLGCDFNIPFSRNYTTTKHVIIPYVNHQYIAFPTISPQDHYIFDINDGWYRLHMTRFGIRQSLYRKDWRGFIQRYLFADLYANAFIDTHTIPLTVPKVYSRVVFNSSYTLRHTIETAWDFFKNRVDHFNIRTQWTINPDLAISLEYRHRDAFAWRKVDYDNYILDAFHTIEELHHSQLSDRRDTALLHFFYRFHPTWAVEFESRHGWNRRNRSRYTEFEVDLLATLRSAWQVKLAYQHKESEDRVAVYFSIGLPPLDRIRSSDLVPFLEF